MAEIKRKQSFGGVNVARFSPEIAPDARKAMNIDLSFDEGLKLYFSLGQLLGKLNSYNRSHDTGRRAAATLCVYLHKKRITVVESRLPKSTGQKLRNGKKNQPTQRVNESEFEASKA